MSSRSDDTTTFQPRPSSQSRSARRSLGLVQLHPPIDGKVWPLGKQTRLGRGADCAIRVEDAAVSRLHARVRLEGTKAVLEDAGSRFGTHVDGVPVQDGQRAVAVGGVVRLGQTLLLLVEDPERYRTPPRRLAADFIGLPHDVFAGPATWEDWQATMVASALEHPVLIMGESGTGKEVLARLLHVSRPQPSQFVALNLAAIPAGLFEAELFGCTRGAFTGASHARPGAFREANGGTLFLDEIGELSPELQVKLLRALETNSVRPLGATGDVAVRTRVVAATNRDLQRAVDTGSFRADLFYRLCTLVVRSKPLRERRDEILFLARVLLERECPGVGMTVETAEQLLLRPWAGNLRELRHVVVRAALSCRARTSETLEPDDLPAPPLGGHLEDTPLQLSEEGLRQALVKASGNARRAAEFLGVSRATLYNFCARNQLDIRELRAPSQHPNAVDHE
jgi:transcriptional regulator of acetoin/glycerol metabolism